MGAIMDLDRPLDIGREKRHLDDSGTPMALIEMARQMGNLLVLDAIADADVLVEYPMGAIWRRETGCERFVRLRARREGKQYALVRAAPSSSPPSKRRKVRATHSPHPPAEALLPYAEHDVVGGKLGLAGAGIMAYMTGDQMHPPMVNDAELWSDATRWPEAAALHTREAANLVELRSGERVLDIGCGIGGPARQLVDEHDAWVYGVANSGPMIETAKAINQREARWQERIEVDLHDCQNPYTNGPFDVAWSMNMFYVVPDKATMLRNVYEALHPGGRLMLEDWMVSGPKAASARELMAQHFTVGSLAEVDELLPLLGRIGFRVTEQEDLGHVGRTHLAHLHNPAFDASVRPRLVRDFPAPPDSGAPSGSQMADEWIASMDAVIGLYREHRMTYLRLVCVKPDIEGR
jgi:cyclopropane fatty-acyl-phospholipid synthase-like methyltransferase